MGPCGGGGGWDDGTCGNEGWGTWGPGFGGGGSPWGAELDGSASVGYVRERGRLKMRARFEGGRRIGPRGVFS